MGNRHRYFALMLCDVFIDMKNTKYISVCFHIFDRQALLAVDICVCFHDIKVKFFTYSIAWRRMRRERSTHVYVFTTSKIRFLKISFIFTKITVIYKKKFN